MARKASLDELRLLEFLVSRAKCIDPPSDWKRHLVVTPLNDGGMGSLRLFDSEEADGARKFGQQVSEVHFYDVDGVEVIASLNVDQLGRLFELDIWKTNFGPLIRFPDKFELEI